MRIAVTEIDSYRRFRKKDDDEAFAELVARLRYRGTPTPRMLAGRAFHKALEYARPGVVDDLQADGYLFTFAHDFDGALELPPTRELRHTMTIMVAGIEVTVVGVIDASLGLRIDDHKFVTSFNADAHVSTFQWRLYLQMFDAHRFRWNAFVGRDGEQRDTYVITEQHTLECTRYPGMENDVMDQVEGLVNFIRNYVPERLDPTFRKRTF